MSKDRIEPDILDRYEARPRHIILRQQIEIRRAPSRRDKSARLVLQPLYYHLNTSGAPRLIRRQIRSKSTDGNATKV